MGDDKNEAKDDASESGGIPSTEPSESSFYATDEDEEARLELGPKISIREQLEKDKVGKWVGQTGWVTGQIRKFGLLNADLREAYWKTDDESLRRWKEQLLGGVVVNEAAGIEEPDVKILSLSIVVADRPDIVLEIPESGHPKGLWFTLKEGSKYSLRFSFKISNNIVCGLKYTNTVWKKGIKVDSSKQMLGTFSPQAEPYIHVMTEETTPSGMFARGSYSAKTKFLDDDNKCYLELTYTFDIQKDWAN
ncbi:rho GDP-dissociation inhibitor 1-like [Bidens hawaiensis]|uniref:rho GDP-dissociation inhibitor 1-like n=1 Tax=Bidens hawaiensis TaxID=980011 RepID=UPI00404B587B